jgi:hypothetical protein
MVLRPVSVVNPALDRSAHRFGGNLLRHARGNDSPRLLPHRGLVPLESSARCSRARNERRRPRRTRSTSGCRTPPVFTERCDVQVIRPSDLAKLMFRPCGHCGSSLNSLLVDPFHFLFFNSGFLSDLVSGFLKLLDLASYLDWTEAVPIEKRASKSINHPLRHGESAQRFVIRSSSAGYRAPCTGIFAVMLSISWRSSEVSSRTVAPMFSSTRASLVVPGIGSGGRNADGAGPQDCGACAIDGRALYRRARSGALPSNHANGLLSSHLRAQPYRFRSGAKGHQSWNGVPQRWVVFLLSSIDVPDQS